MEEQWENATLRQEQKKGGQEDGGKIGGLMSYIRLGAAVGGAMHTSSPLLMTIDLTWFKITVAL